MPSESRHEKKIAVGRTLWIIAGVVVFVVIGIVFWLRKGPEQRRVGANREGPMIPIPRPDRSDSRGRDERFISIVLVLKQPRTVTRNEFEAACERAFGNRPQEHEVVVPPPPKESVQGFILLRRKTGLALLSSAKPYVADTTVAVPGDDAEMAAAEAEAKRRWPEFVTAFGRKHPLQGFAVKIPLATAHQSWEHTWVEVLSLDGQTISGKLANEPHDLPGKNFGDPVTVDVGSVEDWIYQDGREMVGGFTSKVLQARQRK
jgi:uncharacterized protein YegJ (DUF2314 family)